LASLGLRTLDEAIGRGDLLQVDRAVAHWKADGLDLAPVLAQPDGAHGAPRRTTAQDHELDEQLDSRLLAQLERAALGPLAGEPLRVVQIAPGMVRTEEFAAKRFGGDPGKVEALYAGVEHPLLAEDVAEAIVHAIELPSHVNLDEVIIRPVAQAAQHKLVREPLRVREG
ncbi:MAG: hypothetical protein ACLGH5_07330, partial [Actinomycetes bacterium]